MTLYRCSRPGGYGLMGDTFNSTRTTLNRLFAECDRLQAEYERDEYLRAKAAKPKDKTAVAPAEKIGPQIKRSYDDGVERIWIAGYSQFPYMIHGIANTARINSHGCSQLPRGAIFSLPIPVLWAHAAYGDPIGEVCYLQRDERGIYVRARIFEHEAGQHAWKQIVLGKVDGLSMAADNNDPSLHMQAEVDGVRFYDRWKIKEVSLTSNPANEDCYFKIYTPLKGRE